MAREEAALIAGEMRDAFANFRRLAKVTRPISTPILDANGNLISGKSRKLEYRRNYYNGLFDRSNTPDFEQLITTAQSVIEDPTINCSESTVEEVVNCLNKMKNGKAPGICNITPETMKAGGTDCSIWLTNIFPSCLAIQNRPIELEKKGLSCHSIKGKVAERRAKTIEVSLYCPAPANCLHEFCCQE